MAEKILTEVLKTIAGKVGSEVYDSIVSAADIDSQIKELHDLKSSIEAAVLDADSAQVCSHSQRDVLKKLERGLDKLIDFQDAKATKAKQKEVMGGSKLNKEVSLFFSSSNQLVSPFKDARKLKGITGELSLAARNYTQFGTICSSSSVNKHGTLINESGSFTSTDMIVGRDGDRDYMVNSLLESSAAAGILSVASMVGMGGVGKTALAQYVYNDDKVKKYFDLQLWVSTTQEFNVKDVLRKALTSAREEAPLDYEMDQLLQHLFRAIAGKKFLLVLDGVWDSDDLRAKWLELKALLRFGGQGSKVLLTTRSDTVAKEMGTQKPYMVGDLGDDDSWRLFQHVAATERHEPGVEAIAKEIANMCPRVPLVIHAIGSPLAGKHTVQQWQAFRNDQLTNLASYGRDVMSTLKLSYDHLGVGLKLCVLYYSVFPEGFTFHKSFLIRLWIAMGYVEAKYENQSLEDAAEEYLLCLFERGFLGKGYEWPDSFRMHKLEKVYMDMEVLISLPKTSFLAFSSLESLWVVGKSKAKAEQTSLPSNVTAVQKQPLILLKSYLPKLLNLHLTGIETKSLPEEFRGMSSLKLLGIRDCETLEGIPEWIDSLTSLETLFIEDCPGVKSLPHEISNLTNLKWLSLS